MDKWPHQVPSLSQRQIHKAIADPNWQTFRLSLKGLSTREKLTKLDRYLMVNRIYEESDAEVQVANYINALRRGGQLDEHNMVQR